MLCGRWEPHSGVNPASSCAVLSKCLVSPGWAPASNSLVNPKLPVSGWWTLKKICPACTLHVEVCCQVRSDGHLMGQEEPPHSEKELINYQQKPGSPPPHQLWWGRRQIENFITYGLTVGSSPTAHWASTSSEQALSTLLSSLPVGHAAPC